MLRHLLH